MHNKSVELHKLADFLPGQSVELLSHNEQIPAGTDWLKLRVYQGLVGVLAVLETARGQMHYYPYAPQKSAIFTLATYTCWFISVTFCVLCSLVEVEFPDKVCRRLCVFVQVTSCV